MWLCMDFKDQTVVPLLPSESDEPHFVANSVGVPASALARERVCLKVILGRETVE